MCSSISPQYVFLSAPIPRKHLKRYVYLRNSPGLDVSAFKKLSYSVYAILGKTFSAYKIPLVDNGDSIHTSTRDEHEHWLFVGTGSGPRPRLPKLETEYLIQLESLLRLLIMSLGAAAPRCDVNRVTEHESKNLSSESSTNRDHQMFAQNPLKIRRQDRITKPREETESSVVEVLDGRK
jgi:hypothetical protein